MSGLDIQAHAAEVITLTTDVSKWCAAAYCSMIGFTYVTLIILVCRGVWNPAAWLLSIRFCIINPGIKITVPYPASAENVGAPAVQKVNKC